MRYAYYTLVFLVLLTVSIMGFRGMRSTPPPIEVFPDMDRQARYKPQAESALFALAAATGASALAGTITVKGTAPTHISWTASPSPSTARRRSSPCRSVR